MIFFRLLNREYTIHSFSMANYTMRKHQSAVWILIFLPFKIWQENFRITEKHRRKFGKEGIYFKSPKRKTGWLQENRPYGLIVRHTSPEEFGEKKESTFNKLLCHSHKQCRHF